MSFKKVDADTGIAEREIKGALDQAQRGPAPEALTEGERLLIRQQAEKLAYHKKSARGELPRTR
jgi:hypothetical protein